MYNPQDPVGKVTETMAKLFAVMADEVLQEMGQEKGEAVVKRAVRRFANMRAQKIIENIKKDGKEVTFHTVEEYSDYPANEAWDCDSFVEGNTRERSTASVRFPRLFVRSGLKTPESSTARRSTLPSTRPFSERSTLSALRSSPTVPALHAK